MGFYTGSPTTFTNLALAGSQAGVSWSTYAGGYTHSLLNAGSYTPYLLLQGFGFTIPAGETVVGYQFNYNPVIWLSTFGDQLFDYDVRMYAGGSLVGTHHISTTAYDGVPRKVGLNTDDWGVAFTGADVNSSAFGIAISTRDQGTGNAQSRFPLASLSLEVTTLSGGGALSNGLVHLPRSGFTVL